MNLIDSHCHLDFSQFDSDRDQVLARARQAGVTALVNPGADMPSSRRAMALAQEHDPVFAAVGIHPHDASTLDDKNLDELARLAANPKVVAIGEIGLDYYRDLSPRPQQRTAFEEQLALADRLDMPVIIHCRDAADDVMAVLHAWQGSRTGSGAPVGVFHAFSGDLAMAEAVVDMGFLIGVGGPLTYKNARHLPDVAAGLPVEALVLETDAPYLTPHPFRGKRNEPAYVSLVAEKLADLRRTPADLLCDQISRNTRRAFRLPEADA
jgi:TatD DNase family protein